MRLEIKRKKTKSAADDTRPMPGKAIGHVMQVPLEQSVCAACGTCEVMCPLEHGGTTGPMHQRIWIDRNEFEGYPVVLTCHQCDAPECYFACPTGALRIAPGTHARVIDEEVCVGCLKCREACAYDPPRINYDPVKDKALKCDLCHGRPEGPICVEFCPQKALVLDVKEAYNEM